MAWSGKGVCRLVLPGLVRSGIERAVLAEHPAAAPGDPAAISKLLSQVQEYFEGAVTSFKADLDLSWAAPFQRRVYEALCAIPFGETWSYARVAEEAGSPRAFRAVGRANSLNRIPLVIPCHRVIASDGGLGGFSAPGGTAYKQRMLDHEREALKGQKTGTV